MGSLEPESKEEEKEGPKVKPGHRLLIKTAILMPTAKKDEVTVVQIESEGYNKQTVTVPICAMKGGVDLQKYVDLLVPGPAKMKIIHGEGPINLIGSHCVDYYGFKEDEDSDDDEEEDGDTENEMESEEQQEEKTKKKSGDGKKVSPAKKAESPAGKKEEKKATPDKEESKKRKASSEPKSAEKKSKN